MTSIRLTCLACGQGNRLPEEKLTDRPICAECRAPLVSDAPTEVDLARLQKAAKLDDLPLVVDFWAPWCGPCRSMAPEFAKAAATLEGRARLVKLNTEEHAEAGSLFGIRGIPLLVQFQGGQERKRQAGAMPAQAIVDWVTG